jgi:hypothetical protein
MAFAIGGLLSIPVIQHYMPKPGQVSMNDPLSASPEEREKSTGYFDWP